MTLPMKRLKIFRWVNDILEEQQSHEIDRELPFTAMLFTILAASGISLYDSWKKLASISLLPNLQHEAQDVVRRVEVLGQDPLTVMQKKAEKTRSKLYREFLAGYVSSVRSGGNVVSFLKSKLRSIFEIQSTAAIRSVEKLGTLVEAYAVMLIVTLCTYILFIVVSSTSFFELSRMGGTPILSQPILYFLIFGLTPFISIIFITVAHTARKSNLLNIKTVYYSAVIPALCVAALIIASLYISQLEFMIAPMTFPLFITICLCAVSFLPALTYFKIERINYAAEEAMPSFLRDVTEARKIGLSPEKSIIHATKRTGYGKFSDVLSLIRSQMEWGISIRKIFRNIKKKIQTWPVLVNLLILVETIKIGGGSATALEILTEYGEKMRDVEVNKRSLLKPYIVLAFVWSILIAMTTTIVAMTLHVLTQISLPGATVPPTQVMMHSISVFSVGIILQCWISGFFIGKVSEGTLAAGFKYSIMLAITAYVSLWLSQNFLGGMFNLIS
jgi:flagellar protein FlaJ